VRAEADTDQESGPDASLQENTRGRRRLLRFPDLNQGEGDEKQDRQNQQDDDPGISPLARVSTAQSIQGSSEKKTYAVCGSSPLQGEAEANNSRNQNHQSICVELHQFISQRHVNAWAVRYVEQEPDHNHNNGTNWQVDIKTPAPGDICSESAAD